MDTGERLRGCRERSSFTQEQVAKTLAVPRELVSLWETGKRVPKQHQFEQLASLYQVRVEYLLGELDRQEVCEREVLYRGISEGSKIRPTVNRWVDFLDSWAEFLNQANQEHQGLYKTPRKLDRGFIEDSRRAPTLAAEVREYFSLGTDAAPDLYAFLDELGIIVYKLPLGGYTAQGRDQVSGAFYNHPKLGYCILVNADTTLGRQAFTLAHEFAHALYHYSKRGITSTGGAYADPKERFANVFAAHFLVPAKTLKQMAAGGNIDPHKALQLAAYFRVSYATMLMRLAEEKLITYNQKEEWRQYGPRSMAKQLNLSPELFQASRGAKTGKLDRYPLSVFEQIKLALQTRHTFLANAAQVLDVSEEDLKSRLIVGSPKTEDVVRRELNELPPF